VNLDDQSTELTLKQAAELCGVTEKTLGRDRDDRGMAMDLRGARWWVTVGALIAHGRYTPTKDDVSERLARGKAEARVAALEADLTQVRMRSEFQTQTIARLESEIVFLRSLVTGAREAA
jgi:hypothetical protein